MQLRFFSFQWVDLSVIDLLAQLVTLNASKRLVVVLDRACC